jgi:HemY protein
MRALFWILSAAAIIVALLALRSSAGYVQIVWPPHRVELSLPLTFALLLGGFVLAYFALRLIGTMLAMPRRVREYRRSRRLRKGNEALIEAVHEFFSGRFARAEKAAKSAIELKVQPGLSAVLAARAADELRAPERRDAYLHQSAAHLASGDVMKSVTEADVLLNDRRAGDALKVLDMLPQKHTAGLRLELRALQQTDAWDKSLAVIDQLEKRKVYDAGQAADLRAQALAEHIRRHAADLTKLDEAWNLVPRALRQDARVVRAAAEGYIALSACDRAAELIERGVEQNWDSDLVALYGDCTVADAAKKIERAERWLTAHPQDASLLCALGRLCTQQSLWGKAHSYLDASLSAEPTLEAHLAAAQLHEKLGDAAAAQKHYRAGLDLALTRLKQQRD